MKIGLALEVALSPNGSVLATTGERRVTSWLVWPDKPKPTAKRYRSYGVPNPTAVAFVPDGLRLLIKTQRGELFVTTAIDPRDLHAQLPSFGFSGPKPLFLPKCDLVVDATFRGAVCVLDVTSRALVWKRDFRGFIASLHSTGDGGTWMFAHASRLPKDTRPPVTDFFTVWSHPFGEEPIGRVEPNLPLIRTAALSPDGARLALVCGEPPEAIVLLDTGSDQVVARAEPLEFGGTPCNLAWAPDGKTFASVQRGRVALYDPSLRLVGEHTIKYGSSLEFSSDGTHLAIGSLGTGALVHVSDFFDR